MKKIIKAGVALFLILTFTACAKTAPYNPDTQDSKVNKVFMPTNEAKEDKFLLVAEGHYLNLYQINDAKTLKNSQKIDFSLFPQKDIMQLESGMSFDKIDKAYEAMESFIN